jgi:hypothetical protein
MKKTTVLEDKLFKSFTENLAKRWEDDLIAEAGKSLRKTNPCWKGYHPVGTKKKGGKTVPNCVPTSEAANPAQQAAIAIAKKKKKGVAEDWNKVNHHDKTDGLSQKAVNAYRHENPGSKLQTAVTTKPSKLKAGSKDAKRRKSFCARMSGNKGPMRDEKGRPTPKAKALRRWNCEE